MRSIHLRRQPYCQFCGRTDGLEVHHIIPFHVEPKLELEADNLITLCEKSCHFIVGHFSDWTLYNPDGVATCSEFQWRKFGGTKDADN